MGLIEPGGDNTVGSLETGRLIREEAATMVAVVVQFLLLVLVASIR